MSRASFFPQQSSGDLRLWISMANFPMGRRDYSRSPSRQGYHDDYRERDYSREESGREHSYGGGQSRGRYHPDEHDYSGMYDEQPHSDEQDWYRDDRGHQGHHSPARRRHSRSRSRSPRGDPGQPSDTIILEGLPTAPSVSEVRTHECAGQIQKPFSIA